MKRKIFSALCAFLLTVPAMHAQWVVTDPGNLAQGIVNSVNEMVETSENGAERHVHLQGGLENL